jgi:hypothetical protein
MSPDIGTAGTRRLWCASYAALLRVLPRTLRERHGEVMLDLYTRELERRGQDGLGQESLAALAGLADLVERGVQERVAAEQRAMGRHDLVQLRQLALGFVMACSLLTALLVAQAVLRRFPGYADERALALVLYSVPYTLAITVPMAVFVAVLQVAAPAEGAERRGLPGRGDHAPGATPRLIPILAFGATMTLLSLPLTMEVVPRANARLEALITGQHQRLSDRSLTLGALRQRAGALAQAVATPLATGADGAARGEAPSGAGATGERRKPGRMARLLASYAVEVHKRVALPVACVVLSLLAAALARRHPAMGLGHQLLTAGIVFAGYWLALMAGETLAEQLVLSPVLAMWGANAVALLGALVAVRTAPSRGQRPPRLRATA